MFTRRVLLLAGAALAASLATPALAQDKVKAVASFSILGDLMRNVGGERLDLTVLVGPNGDAHVYNPTPADAKAMADARLVVVNGLGFEGWMERLVKASGSKAETVVASQGVAAISMEDDDHGHGHGKDKGKHAHAAADPHAWQSVANAKLYVANIRDGLVKADPAGRATYEANATAYLAKLDALEAEVKAAVARIPADRRRIITSHDAFGYFGKAYGVEFIAPQGVSTDAEASAKDVGRIIRQIKTERIPAVFLENITDPRLVSRIAKETGAKIGGTIFSDALSPPDGPAGTYIEMIRNNIKQLSVALGS